MGRADPRLPKPTEGKSAVSNAIQQNYGIHLDSSDVEQVLMQEETILDEEIILEIQRMAENANYA